MSSKGENAAIEPPVERTKKTVKLAPLLRRLAAESNSDIINRTVVKYCIGAATLAIHTVS